MSLRKNSSRSPLFEKLLPVILYSNKQIKKKLGVIKKPNSQKRISYFPKDSSRRNHQTRKNREPAEPAEPVEPKVSASILPFKFRMQAFCEPEVRLPIDEDSERVYQFLQGKLDLRIRNCKSENASPRQINGI